MQVNEIRCHFAPATNSSSGIHMYLESPPYDQTERWSGRPFRSLAIVIPPSGVNLDPTKTQRCKARFLERLWNAQARYRARAGQSVVLRSEMMEVEAKRGKTVYAKTYYNVYQRTAFMQESKKVSLQLFVRERYFTYVDIIDQGCCAH